MESLFPFYYPARDHIQQFQAHFEWGLGSQVLRGLCGSLLLVPRSLGALALGAPRTLLPAKEALCQCSLPDMGHRLMEDWGREWRDFLVLCDLFVVVGGCPSSNKHLIAG